MFSMKIPYPVVGSLTKTWVTAPISFPSCIRGLPLTLMSSRGQKKFAEKLRFYPKNTQKRRFLHRSTRIPQLKQMKCRKKRLIISPAFSTNSELYRTVGFICPQSKTQAAKTACILCYTQKCSFKFEMSKSYPFNSNCQLFFERNYNFFRRSMCFLQLYY